MADQLRDALNKASPNNLADYLRALGLGDLLGAIQTLRGKFNFNTAPANASQLATLQTMALDPHWKASVVTRATVRAGGVTGELAAQAYGTTPATTQIAVAPNGDIVALAADAITDVDVQYTPMKCDVVTLTNVPVVPGTGVLTIPAQYVAQGVAYLHSATATAGTVIGQKIILVPGAVNPATGKARISVDKATINFTVADAVSKADVVLSLVPAIDAYAKLIAAPPG